MEGVPSLDGMENEIDDLCKVMNERGLIRQYSISCIDRLQELDIRIKSVVSIMTPDSENFDRAQGLLQKVSQLVSAHNARVPISELVRRATPDSMMMDNQQDFMSDDISTIHREKIRVTDRSGEDSEEKMSPLMEPEQQLTRMLSISSDLLISSTEESLNNGNKLQTPSSTLYSWGRSDFSALFHPDTEIHKPPEPVSFHTKRTFLQISSNCYHSAIITTSGELYVCGSNEEGQVVDDQNAKMIVRPRLFESINQRICTVACGAYHTVCVTATGIAISFGGNEAGQLGHSLGHISSVPPKAVEGLRGRVVTDVVCGELITILRTSAGEVYTCGVGGCSGLATAEGTNVHKATRVHPLASKFIEKIGCGSHHCFALAATGELYGWGSNINGQLGINNNEGEGKSTAGARKPDDTAEDTIQTPRLILIENLESYGRVIGMTGGYAHSLIWTTAGVLLGSGSNKYGQLGVLPSLRVSSFTRLSLPESDVMTHRVLSAACGQNHSLVLCRRELSNVLTLPIQQGVISSAGEYGNNVVFGFGANSYGQCGSGDGEYVQLQRHPIEIESLSRLGIVHIAAGGEQSFAIGVVGTENQIEGLMQRQFSIFSTKQPHALTAQNIIERLQTADDTNNNIRIVTDIQEHILPIFSTASLLAGSFIDHHANYLYLDIEGLEECYKLIIKHGGSTVISKLLTGLQTIAEDLKNTKLDTSPDILRTILMLWQCPLNSMISKSSDLMNVIASYINLAVNTNMRTNLMNIIRYYPPHIFVSRLLTPLQEHCNHSIRTNHTNIAEISMFCNALGWLYVINSNVKLVTYEKFYITAINDLSDQTLVADYVQWRQKQGQPNTPKTPQSGFSFFYYPFLLSVETKRRILLADSALQQQAAQQQAFMIGAATVGYFMPFFILQIDRCNLLQQTLLLIASASDMDLKKPLKVIFNGEEGIDEGGVRKEFFQLLTSQLFDIQFGMFIEINEGRHLWFNKNCTWSNDEYTLVGVLIGLAVYNGVILDIHLPHVLYKKLLRYPLTLEDIKDVDMEMYKGLKQLLSFEPSEDVESIFCRTFEVTWTDFGMQRSYELIPNGANIPVTGENRGEYVDKYVDWLLNQSISKQFNEFQKGFTRVINSITTALFRPEELELLVAGTPHLDFSALEANTEYIGWNNENEVVKSFWKVIKQLEFNDQQKFLMFVTGSTKAPVGGLGKLNMKLQRMGPDSDMLPTSHTCFNVLLLPEYSSEEKLKDRLLKAIYECEGFGLK